MKATFHFVFAATLAFAPAALRPQPDTEQSRRCMTPRDIWTMERLGSPRISPDGGRIVFTVQTWSIPRNRSTTHLWIVPASGVEPPRQLTRTADTSDSSPRWSPDGRRIAFLSKRADDSNTALYVLPLDGGEAEKIVEMPLGISQPEWLPDGSAIVFATKVIPELAGSLSPGDLAAMQKEARRRKESRMTARATENRIYRHWDKWQTDLLADRLVRVNLADRRVTDLTPASDLPWRLDDETTFVLSPDGTKAVIVRTTGKPPYQELPLQHLWLVPLDGSGRWRDLAPGSPGLSFNPVFSPDGSSILFGMHSKPIHAGENRRLFRMDLKTGSVRQLAAGLDVSFESWGFTVRDGQRADIWVIAEEKGHVPLWRLREEGAGSLEPLHAAGTCSSPDSAAGMIAYLNDTAMRPAELFVHDSARMECRQLTRFNERRMQSLELGRVESLTAAGAGGDPIQMWLTYPPRFDPGAKGRYPLIQLMHGGPHTMARDSWSYRWNSHLFAAPGCLAVWVNRHGSTGFGEKFARSILAEWGEKPLKDILLATEHLAGRIPAIDPGRVAAAGGSYGGYMAAWIAGHTDRFACLVNHAGVADFIGQVGCDTAAYTFTSAEVLGGTPWENPEGMQRNNPIAHAGNFKTPMLIIHGEQDYRVPYGQALSLYGVLKAMGVPARLVVFPNENHWILTPQNSIHWNYEVGNWLARHLGMAPVEKPVFPSEG